MLSTIFGYADYYFVLNKLRRNILACGFKCHSNGHVMLLSQFVQLTMRLSMEAWNGDHGIYEIGALECSWNVSSGDRF